ncbi:hypothetical protein Tco_1482970, partial [Tanacetum coccineum]
PLVSARPGPRFEPLLHHIPGIIFDSVEDSAETPREDRFYASISVDPSIAKDIHHPDWELTNDFIMDKGPLCRNFIDHLVTPRQFSCLRSLSHQYVCDRGNVAATRHITLFFEIRLRLEQVELARGKFERRLAHRDAALEKGDAKVECLQKVVNEKPSEEMARLRLGFDAAEREILRLRKQVEDLKKETGMCLITHTFYL